MLQVADDYSFAGQDEYHLYGSARNMWQAIQVLHLSEQNLGEDRFLATIHLLMGFSVELYLKCALAKTGMPANERRTYGHNLRKLFEEAQRRDAINFPAVDALNVVVDILNEDHQKFSFRYSIPGAVLKIIKSMDIALGVLEQLDHHLRPPPEIVDLATKMKSR